jgi:hypothetical protein
MSFHCIASASAASQIDQILIIHSYIPKAEACKDEFFGVVEARVHPVLILHADSKNKMTGISFSHS